VPDHAEAQFAQGNLAAAAEDFDAAVEAYRRVLASAPGHIGARNNLANVYLVTRRINEAVAEYREVVRLRPGDRLVEDNLQRALEMQGSSTGSGR
jgi:Flp pilus assembly protein TadD